MADNDVLLQAAIAARIHGDRMVESANKMLKAGLKRQEMAKDS